MFAKQIETKQAELNAKRDELTVVTKALAEGDQSQIEVAETLGGEIDMMEKALAALEAAEKRLASSTARSAAVIPGGLKSTKGAEEIWVKQATAKLHGHLNNKSFEASIAELYGRDEQMLAVTKAAVAPADTSTAGYAAELTRISYGSFVEGLRGIAIAPRLAALAGYPMSFDGANSIYIPKRGATGGLAGDFVGEGAPIPVKRGAFGSQTVKRYNIGVISTFTEEILRRSTPSVEALVKRAILDDTAEVLDTKLFDATAETALRPAGLMHGVTEIVGATEVNAQSVLADLRSVLQPILEAKGGRSLVWIMSPSVELGLSLLMTAGGDYVFKAEMAQGKLLNRPYIVSTNAAAETLRLIDAADFACAFDTPSFDMSNQATIHMSATPSKDLVAADVTDVYSMYQTNSVALKTNLPTTWAMVRAGMVGGVKTFKV